MGDFDSYTDKSAPGEIVGADAIWDAVREIASGQVGPVREGTALDAAGVVALEPVTIGEGLRIEPPAFDPDPTWRTMMQKYKDNGIDPSLLSAAATRTAAVGMTCGAHATGQELCGQQPNPFLTFTTGGVPAAYLATAEHKRMQRERVQQKLHGFPMVVTLELARDLYLTDEEMRAAGYAADWSLDAWRLEKDEKVARPPWVAAPAVDIVELLRLPFWSRCAGGAPHWIDHQREYAASEIVRLRGSVADLRSRLLEESRLAGDGRYGVVTMGDARDENRANPQPDQQDALAQQAVQQALGNLNDASHRHYVPERFKPDPSNR